MIRNPDGNNKFHNRILNVRNESSDIDMGVGKLISLFNPTHGLNIGSSAFLLEKI